LLNVLSKIFRLEATLAHRETSKFFNVFSGSKLFDKLRQLRSDFDAFAASKVVLITGDLDIDNIGIGAVRRQKNQFLGRTATVPSLLCCFYIVAQHHFLCYLKA
jgi:hypothetical protein